MIYSIIRKSDGVEITRYGAASIVETINGTAYPLTEFDHVEYVADSPVVSIDPALWRIDVGSFFDRFGDAKLPILSSENAIVKAMITDASVRKYIALIERKDELAQMIALLQSLVPGISLDVAAIIETEPTDAERWNG